MSQVGAYGARSLGLGLTAHQLYRLGRMGYNAYSGYRRARHEAAVEDEIRQAEKKARTGGYVRSGYMPKRLRSFNVGGTAFHHANCVERKFTDRNWAGTTVTNAGIVEQILPDIATGTSQSKRIGQKIFLWEMSLHGTIIMAAQTTNQAKGTTLRYAIVQDRQANGTTPTWAEVFQDADRDTFRNLENSMRFKVLKDGKININRGMVATGSATAPTAPQTPETGIKFDHYFKWRRGLRINYDTDDATGVPAKIASNNLWLLLLSSNSATTTLNVYGKTRVRFTD